MSDYGIITGCDQNLEWVLPWWWEHYAAHNTYPVVFADFGLSEKGRQFCEERGTLLPIPDQGEWATHPSLHLGHEKAYGKRVWQSQRAWFKKPIAALLSPFRKSLWLDIDCKAQGDVGELFEGFEDIALMRSPLESAYLGPDEIRYNSGVIAFKKDAPIISQWAQTAQELRDRMPGDEECLSRAIALYQPRLRELSSSCNWLHALGPNPDALVFHCGEDPGRAEILADIICKTGKSPLPKGICVQVERELEDLVPWWWKHYRAHNAYPVAFIDGGMSDEKKAFCKKWGLVLSKEQSSPFSCTLTLDLDSKVQGAFDPASFDASTVVKQDRIEIFQELLAAAAAELFRFA